MLQVKYFTIENDGQQSMIQLYVLRGRFTLGGDVIGPVTARVSVSYWVIGSSAVQGQDFILQNGTVVFDSDELIQNISVMVILNKP